MLFAVGRRLRSAMVDIRKGLVGVLAGWRTDAEGEQTCHMRTLSHSSFTQNSLQQFAFLNFLVGCQEGLEMAGTTIRKS